jgi:hypothetical protein
MSNARKNLFQSLWDRLGSKKVEAEPTAAPTPPSLNPILDAKNRYIHALQQLKQQCSNQAVVFTNLSKDLEQQSEVCFSQVRDLEDRVVMLVDTADQDSQDGINANWTEERLQQLVFLQQQQEALADQGSNLREASANEARKANKYSELVIELQICLHKFHALRSDQILEVGATVLEFFEERFAEVAKDG